MWQMERLPISLLLDGQAWLCQSYSIPTAITPENITTMAITLFFGHLWDIMIGQ